MSMNDDAMAVESAEDATFDAELSAMFQDAAPTAEDPVFTAHVVSQIGRTDRTRLLAIGGAGATGSAVAGSQLESLISGPIQHLEGVMGQAAGFMGPEAIVTGLFAVLALGIAWIIPKGRLTAL
jgi:hypothetical protein